MHELKINGNFQLGRGRRAKGGAHDIVIIAQLDCKKTPLNIKIHPILERIGFLLYHIIIGKKVGRGCNELRLGLLDLHSILFLSRFDLLLSSVN